MNNTEDIVLGSIKAQVRGQQYYIDGHISDDILKEAYALSKAHDMVHLVAAELISQDIIKNQETREQFKKRQILAIYRYERMHHEFTNICRVLEEAGIPYMPLKGSVIRQYYPEPWMRTSSDIDILVKPEDIPAATEALVNKLGYQNKGRGEHDIQLYSPNGVHLELHFATVEDYRLPAANELLDKIWEKYAVCLKGQHYAMSNEMFYFYHVAHMAKHFQEGGCGIRFFMDMWLLNHSVQYDTAVKKELLQTGELLEFAQKAERLSEIWFGEQSHDDITMRIENYILNGGIYGSRENKMVAKHVNKGGRAGYAMYLVFRPYHELRRTYHILYKHKWLYPFCQIHRWICLLFKGGIFRALRLLNKGAEVFEEAGDSADKMFRDLNLVDLKRRN